MWHKLCLILWLNWKLLLDCTMKPVNIVGYTGIYTRFSGPGASLAPRDNTAKYRIPMTSMSWGLFQTNHWTTRITFSGINIFWLLKYVLFYYMNLWIQSLTGVNFSIEMARTAHFIRSKVVNVSIRTKFCISCITGFIGKNINLRVFPKLRKKSKLKGVEPLFLWIEKTYGLM